MRYKNMTMFLNLGFIEIDWGDFVAFFLGIGTGFLILILFYVYAVIKNINKKFNLHKVQEEDIDEEEIKWMIEDAQKQFKNKDLRNKEGFGTMLLRINKELTMDIASKFYPESKYPYLELTIDETIALNHYITNRLDQLLDSQILRLFRGMTIRRIVEILDTKEKIENTKIVKTVKKHNLGKIASSTMKVLNAVNPFFWFRKLAIDKAIDIIILKISISLIAITGEETYKIYSKKVFNVEKTLETNVEDLYEELKADLKDM